MPMTKLAILIVEPQASVRQRLKTLLLPYGSVVEALEPTDAIGIFQLTPLVSSSVNRLILSS
jgi:hypothetical protein